MKSKPKAMEEFGQVEDELSYFHSTDEEEDADYVEVLSEFVEKEPGTEGDLPVEDKYDWDTGVDYVPEYEEDYEYEGGADAGRSTGIKAFHLGGADQSASLEGVMASVRLEIDWDASQGGWAAPALIRFGDLRLPPGAAVLHHGMLATAELWAFRAAGQGAESVRFFQPGRAWEELQAGCRAHGLPSDWQAEELEQCVGGLVKACFSLVPSAGSGAMLLQVAVLSAEPCALPGTPAGRATLLTVARPVLVDSGWSMPEDLMATMQGDVAPAECPEVPL